MAKRVHIEGIDEKAYDHRRITAICNRLLVSLPHQKCVYAALIPRLGTRKHRLYTVLCYQPLAILRHVALLIRQRAESPDHSETHIVRIFLPRIPDAAVTLQNTYI